MTEIPTVTDVGRLRVLVDAVDRTWFPLGPRYGRATVTSFGSSDPFGDSTARLRFDGVSPWSQPAWLRKDAEVDLVLHRPGQAALGLFSGTLLTDADSIEAPGEWIATGALQLAALSIVSIILDDVERDIGFVIARALTGVVSRTYSAVPARTIGVGTRQFGSPGQYVLDQVRELLTSSSDGTGTTWTVDCRNRVAVLRPKDMTTVAMTWRVGQHGLDVDLRSDLEDDTNVIYGYGVGPDGAAWMGWVFPNMHADTAPAYPNADASDTINVGDTDASTGTGDGVSTFQRKMRELGYNLTVDGVMNANDAEVVRLIQGRLGLQVDGSIGGQTWTGIFAPGSNVGNLDDSYRMPLAWRGPAQPHTYDAYGRIVGANPSYDAQTTRVELDISYGQGITKAEATRAAQRELARVNPSSDWFGRITAQVAGSGPVPLLALRAGMNVELLDHRGAASRVLHVVDADHNPEEGSVSLTVDSRGRDRMTVAAVLERDRDTKRDRARRKVQGYRSSALASDRVIPFDGESAAGWIPRHAMFGGLWNVLRIPVSKLGRVAKLEYHTFSPVTRFSLALFGAPITPADLVTYVGNPLSERGIYKAFDEHRGVLAKRFRLIEAWGEFEEGAGYHADPDDPLGKQGYESRGAPITGWLVDSGGFEYTSYKAPWIWVAEYSPVACFSEGRLFPAPAL